MKVEYIAIVIMIVLALVLLYFGYTHLIKNKNLKQPGKLSSIDIDALCVALGGVENIRNVTFSPSKLTVVLVKHDVDVAAIQNLGASGVVEGKETLSMIFGRESENIAYDLKQQLK